MSISLRRKQPPRIETEEEAAQRLNALEADLSAYAPKKNRMEQMVDEAATIPPDAIRKFGELATNQLDEVWQTVETNYANLEFRVNEIKAKVQQELEEVAQEMTEMLSVINDAVNLTVKVNEQMDRLKGLRRLPPPSVAGHTFSEAVGEPPMKEKYYD